MRCAILLLVLVTGSVLADSKTFPCNALCPMPIGVPCRNALCPMPIGFSCRNALWPMPIGFSFRPFILFGSALGAGRVRLWAGLPLSTLFILRQSRYAHHRGAGRQHDIKRPDDQALIGICTTLSGRLRFTQTKKSPTTMGGLPTYQQLANLA